VQREVQNTGRDDPHCSEHRKETDHNFANRELQNPENNLDGVLAIQFDAFLRYAS